MQAGFGGQFHALEVEVELTDDRVAQALSAAAMEADILRRQRLRNSALCVDISPIRAMRTLSCGLRPASSRSMAAAPFAI